MGSNNIIIDLARHAEKIGADAIAVIPPWAPSRVIHSIRTYLSIYSFPLLISYRRIVFHCIYL